MYFLFKFDFSLNIINLDFIISARRPSSGVNRVPNRTPVTPGGPSGDKKVKDGSDKSGGANSVRLIHIFEKEFQNYLVFNHF